jgi:hypothetical protein
LFVGITGQIRLQNDAQTGGRILQYQDRRNPSRMRVHGMAMTVKQAPGRLDELAVGVFGDFRADRRHEALQRQGDEHKPGEGLRVASGRNDLNLRRDSAFGQRRQDDFLIVHSDPAVMKNLRRQERHAGQVCGLRQGCLLIHRRPPIAAIPERTYDG